MRKNLHSNLLEKKLVKYSHRLDFLHVGDTTLRAFRQTSTFLQLQREKFGNFDLLKPFEAKIGRNVEADVGDERR